MATGPFFRPAGGAIVRFCGWKVVNGPGAASAWAWRVGAQAAVKRGAVDDITAMRLERGCGLAVNAVVDALDSSVVQNRSLLACGPPAPTE